MNQKYPHRNTAVVIMRRVLIFGKKEREKKMKRELAWLPVLAGVAQLQYDYSVETWLCFPSEQ